MLHKLVISILLFTYLLIAQSESDVRYDVFSFEKEVILPGTPEIIFDAVTGDISGWWDHSMSENPKAFYIDPFPGGGFYEIFDDEGNGVLHATVIYADRGKLLRFDGPLGLSGMAIQFVTTYQFDPVGTDSTLLKVSVHAAGEMNETIPSIVESVWEHFIFEQLEPYVKEGKHLQKK
jgi:uncharacterized protein YndB with AHSA1/START domain